VQRLQPDPHGQSQRLNQFFGQNITAPLGFSISVAAQVIRKAIMTPRRFGSIKIERDWRELEEMAAAVAPYEGRSRDARGRGVRPSEPDAGRHATETAGRAARW
jgi:hypothetical protein